MDMFSSVAQSVIAEELQIGNHTVVVKERLAEGLIFTSILNLILFNLLLNKL
jgi:hypothetical protein